VSVEGGKEEGMEVVELDSEVVLEGEDGEIVDVYAEECIETVVCILVLKRIHNSFHNCLF
jgi:hypothetical protein